MICKKCGNEIPENSVFCNVCGERVVEESHSKNAEQIVSEKILPAEPIQQNTINVAEKREIKVAAIILFCLILAIILFGCPATSKNNSRISEYTSSSVSNRKRDAWVCAQDIVQSELKSPSTAKFCSYTEATVTSLGNDKYKIKGYVDAQNGFGAIIRTKFTVTLTLTARGYKEGSVVFE